MNWLQMPLGDAFKEIKKGAQSAHKNLSAITERRTLEKSLLKRKETARDYEKNRVPAGHTYYQLLYDACLADIKAYCHTYGKDFQIMQMGYPFLYSLKKKAYPEDADDRQPGVLAKAFGIAAAAIVACFLAGAATGLFSGGHQLVQGFFA